MDPCKLLTREDSSLFLSLYFTCFLSCCTNLLPCTQLCGRTIRVDHVENYRLPKNLQEQEEQQQSSKSGVGGDKLTEAGQAYKGQEMANKYSLDKGQDLFAPPDRDDNYDDNDDSQQDSAAKKEAKRKRKEERRRKRDEKERRKRDKERRRSDKEEKRREQRARKHQKQERDRDDSDLDNQPRESKKRRYDSDSPR